jgi:hypothetical protein
MLAAFGFEALGVVVGDMYFIDPVPLAGVDITVVMPPFTNAELISGTKTSGASKPVEPEEIAAAIVKALDKPKTYVSVPGPMRFVAALASTLGPRARRSLSKRLGMGRVVLNFDTKARQAYEDRAQSAIGILDHKD